MLEKVYKGVTVNYSELWRCSLIKRVGEEEKTVLVAQSRREKTHIRKNTFFFIIFIIPVLLHF